MPESPSRAVRPSPPQHLQRGRVGVALCLFINGALFAAWVSRIPAIKAKLQLDHGQLGFSLLMSAVGSLLAMPLAGLAVSRFGSRRVALLTTAVYCFSVPWLAVASSHLALTVALFCYGACYGAQDVGANSQAVALEKEYGRPIMSSFHALFSTGGLLGAALGGLIATLGITPFWHFLGVTALMGGGALWYAWSRLWEAGNGRSHAPAAPDGSRFVRPPWRLLLIGLLAFSILMGEGAIADWSAVYLRTETFASEGFAAAGFAAFSIMMAAGRFLGDRLAELLGQVRLVQYGCALAAAGLGGALLLGGTWPGVLGFAAVGAGFSTVVPQVFSAAGRMPGLPAGPAIATATTLGYTGFLLGPAIIGFVAEALGLRWGLGVISLMSLITALLAPCLSLPAPAAPKAD